MKQAILEKERKKSLDEGFENTFGGRPQAYYSAPGRTEMGGNHTDHQRGHVLAGAVDLDIAAAVRPNGTDTVQLLSRGRPLCRVDLRDPAPREEEKNTTAGLIRGVAGALARAGKRLGGFDAYCESQVPVGSGLSSSAAFEVLVGTVFLGLFAPEEWDPILLAQAGQYAENVYFGKPSGLMDQMASAVGGLVAMDFETPEKPLIRRLDGAFPPEGWALCILDSGAGHEDLTEEYGAIPEEMARVAAFFGSQYLRQVEPARFFRSLPRLRGSVPDRAILRALHFFREEQRVCLQEEALRAGNFQRFLELVSQSGRSSFMYLQNVIPAGAKENQALALTLGLCDALLEGRGAFRVHGGGFAGTVQAYVPEELLDSFRCRSEEILGKGSCHVLSIRPLGGAQLVPEQG